MQDYNYLYGNCLEITMELSCCKYPLAAQLHNEWDLNRESLVAYIEKVKGVFWLLIEKKYTIIGQHVLGIYIADVFQVHIGVRGYVKEALNGAALTNVSIVVTGIHHNLTTGKYGDYYRLLLPGTYNITAVATGWVSPLTFLRWLSRFSLIEVIH